ncbi:hypothetical protein ACH4U5_27425 [Streptomyces sp. NPDC020858]|uniref:hypothetical protein n=1 Tax=Streptomyces sp. NPDC020858 TaxID=3365097 RepID=UPI0037AA1733
MVARGSGLLAHHGEEGRHPQPVGRGARPAIGRRRFTAVSTVVLIVPLLWLGFVVQNPDTPYSTMVAIAALCGIGGANFSSSPANIGFFYPKQEKGNAHLGDDLALHRHLRLLHRVRRVTPFGLISYPA